MIERLQDAVRPLRRGLIDHPIYTAIDSPEALRCFMEHHVFAVWDFMTLLKALQRRLTCVATPWAPTADPAARRLINEIVLAEESDDDGQGGFASHFESYLGAMAEAGAGTHAINRFVALVAAGRPVADALDGAGAPAAAAAFVRSTWAVVEADSLPGTVAAFTVGREDLIPDLFRGLVARVTAHDPDQYRSFLRYLDRHVHLDGDEHGPMVLNLLKSTCGDDPARWDEATRAAAAALEARRRLWDGVVRAIGEQSAS